MAVWTADCFPIGDARYEAALIPRVQLVPIPSLWRHPADRRFLDETIAASLSGARDTR